MLFQRKRSFLKKPKFKDSGAILKNPYQGWYRIYMFDLQYPFDPEETKWCLHAEENLCLVEINLGAYASGPIATDAIERLREILTFFDHHGKQVILRFAYDFEGKAMEKEPTEVEIIYGHMEQVAAVSRVYVPMIVCFQGLFIGSWGEMHSSRYATEQTLDGLYQKFRSAFGSNVCLAVRRLAFMERWQDADARLTLFDDGIFGSDTDLGTFAGDREAGIAKVEAKTTFLPVGGEVLGEQLVQGTFPMEAVRRTMEGLHISYLNSMYDEVGLHFLREQKGLDDISRKMGYRLWISDVDVEGASLHITIQNGGYGGFHLPGRLQLQNDCGDVIETVEMPCIPSGGEADITCRRPDVGQRLYVSAIINNRYPLVFANGTEDAVYIGELHV